MDTIPTDRLTPAEILKQPYHRVIVPDEDGSFSAEISEFPGCIAVGETATEALLALEEVADGWLRIALKNNQRIPAPTIEPEYSGKTLVRFPKGLHRDAAKAAERDGVSLNQFIVTAVAMHVGGLNAAPSIPGGMNLVTVLPQQNSGIVYVDYSITASKHALPTMQSAGTMLSWNEGVRTLARAGR